MSQFAPNQNKTNKQNSGSTPNKSTLNQAEMLKGLEKASMLGAPTQLKEEEQQKKESPVVGQDKTGKGASSDIETKGGAFNNGNSGSIGAVGYNYFPNKITVDQAEMMKGHEKASMLGAPTQLKEEEQQKKESTTLPVNDNAALENEADGVSIKAAEGKSADMLGKGNGMQDKTGDVTTEPEGNEINSDLETLRGAFNNGISSSVGAGGDNYYLDVISVAKALSAESYTVSEDALIKGICSDTLIKTIKTYQKNKLKAVKPDGRIDPTSYKRFTGSGSYKVGGTWNKLNPSAGEYKNNLTSIYGENAYSLNKRLKASSKILKGDVGKDTKKNKAENYPEDIKLVSKALQENEITVPEKALTQGESGSEFIKAIEIWQIKQQFKIIDGNITAGGTYEGILFPKRKSYSINKLVRTKQENGGHKFETGNLQDGAQYMETIDKLGEQIGLKENSEEAKVIAIAEKAAINEIYFNTLTKDVPSKVIYARKKAGDNTLNPVLESRMNKFYKFMVVAGLYRGDMQIGKNGAVRDPYVGHQFAVEHFIVTGKTPTTIKNNLIKMYNDSSISKNDDNYVKDLDGNKWAKKSSFTTNNKGKATNVNLSEVKTYVNQHPFRDNKTSAAAEGYKHNNVRRYPLSLTGSPNRSNHVEGNAIDVSSKLFVNRNDAIIDLIALKFGVFRCAGGEQWHFELTNVVLDEAEKEQHLSGTEVASASSISNSSAEPTENKPQSNTTEPIEVGNVNEEYIQTPEITSSQETDINKSVGSTNEILNIKTQISIQQELQESTPISESEKPEIEPKESITKTDSPTKSNTTVASTAKKQSKPNQTIILPISASVGKGGENEREDVLFVARKLTSLGYFTGIISLSGGKCDTQFIQAIILFQQANFNSFKPDGLISKNKGTIKKLVSLSKEQQKYAGGKAKKTTPQDLLIKHGDNLSALGKELAGFAIKNPELVNGVIDDIGYWSRDNLSVEICKNILDSELSSVSKPLLRKLYNEINDISTKATYIAWLVNPAISATLSISTIKDFQQLSRLENVLALKKDNTQTEKGAVNEDWVSYIKEGEIKDKSILTTILSYRNSVTDHSDKLKSIKNGCVYGGTNKGKPSSSKANKAQSAIWEELAGEGGYESINTWDKEVFTWGKGFAAGGQLPNVIDKLMTDSHMKREFQQVGITQIENTLYVVNPQTGKILIGMEGYKHISVTPKLLDFFIELGNDKMERQKIIDAQYEVVMSKAGKVPDFVFDAKNNKYKGGWNDSAVKLAAHLSHWLPAGGWGSSSSFYKSSNGDILKIVQAFCLTLQKTTKIVNLKTERYIWEVLKYTAVFHLNHKNTAGGIGMEAVNGVCPTPIDAIKAKTDDKYKNHILLPQGSKYYVIKKTI